MLSPDITTIIGEGGGDIGEGGGDIEEGVENIGGRGGEHRGKGVGT